MPTGYTAAIKRGISFRRFALLCARAMGACVMQRDEDADVLPTIPEPSDYHVKALESDRSELVKLFEWSTEDIEREAKKAFMADMERYAINNLEKTELRNKYNAMLARVVAWEPPTAEHKGLRDFMVQQITSSIKGDCYELESPTCLAPEQWYQKKIDTLTRNIEYHESKNTKEISRAAERGAWITALYESLPKEQG